MSLTYFVGIGAQKAGTTWLADYFYDHPEVFMAPYKEMHFFVSRELWAYNAYSWRLWWRRRGVDLTKYGSANAIHTEIDSRTLHRLYLRTCAGDARAYREFIDFGAAGKKAAGEITPLYTDLDRRAYQAMDRTLPGCKFFFLVRSPLARLHSQMRMHHSKGKRQRPIEEILSHAHYSRRGDYRRTLEELSSVVSNDRILVTFYEELFDPALAPREVQRICDHINISFIAPDWKKIVNSAKSPPINLSTEDCVTVVRHYEDTYRFIEDYVGRSLPDAWRNELSILSRGGWTKG